MPIPLEEPPPASSLPTLPSPPRTHAFTATYTLSTHIIPVAYPRTPSHVFPRAPPANLDVLPSVERKRALAAAAAEAQALRNAYERGELEGRESDANLWLALNRYVRRSPGEVWNHGKGLTLVCTHAIGFCKEVCLLKLSVL
jgi:hypothetical protein